MAETSQKSYVITKDIAPTLRNRFGLDLSAPVIEEIRGLESAFIEEFWQCINVEDQRVVLADSEITSAIETSTKNETRPIVCFDDVYFPNLKALSFSITRLTDPQDPKNYVIGPRPGFPALETQLRQLQSRLGRSNIAVVDVGAFTADSVTDTLAYFQRAGLRPCIIYLGLAGVDGVEKLRQQGVDVRVTFTYNFDDWLELRDLFGIDGRKVDQTKVDFRGIEEFRGKNLFIPYTEEPTGWASISAEKHGTFRKLHRAYREKIAEALRKDKYVFNLQEILRHSLGIYNLEITQAIET